MKKCMALKVGVILGVALSQSVVGTMAGTVTNVVFSDDFESGTVAAWTATMVTNPLAPSTLNNVVPAAPAGQWSARLTNQIARMHHNIIGDNGGAELGGHAIFTSWIYDNGVITRCWNEVRGYAGGTGLPNGGTVANGSLSQLLAIGKYNTSTLPGDPYNSSKYQGRAAFTTNTTIYWFNLNGAGSPNRSVGWHRFDVERSEDGSSVNFYVDGILSRSISDVKVETWDTVIMGPGVANSAAEAFIDGVCVGTITAAPVPERFVKTSLLPPPEGEYVTPERYHARLAGGVIVSNISHRLFTASVPPLPPGAPPQLHTFQSAVAMEYAPCQTCVAAPAKVDNAPVQVMQLSSREEAGKLIIETEMTGLEIMGGTLLPGVMIRESPTRASTGQTTVRAVRDGFMISSFFDIYIEVSTDGGGSWEPALDPAHVELIVDPTTFPAVAVPSPLLPPPNEQYVTPEQYHLYLANGIVIRDIKHKLFTGAVQPPPPGAVVTHTFNSVVDFQLSTDGGALWSQIRAEAPVGVSIRERREEMEKKVYDTEMTSLTIQGGDLPAGVMIRESPTKKSEGGTVLSSGGADNDCDSFFDIYLEVSTDGGGSWTPADQPARVQLAAVDDEDAFPTDRLPPPTGRYVSPQQWHAYFARGIVIRDVIHREFTKSIPPPAAGQTVSHPFGSQVEMDVSTDGGGTYTRVTMPAEVQVRITGTVVDGPTRYFDTEMEALQITSGVPGAVMIRESPTRASQGRTSIRADGTDNDCDSFFDIFIEVSIDGGQTWEAANAPVTMILQPGGPRPLSIVCPNDITTNAMSPAGRVVTWTIMTMGGTPPVNVNCVPASGSTFPIGVTPVTCTATDAGGQTASCSFQVTVRRPRPPAHFFREKVLPPLQGEYISPQRWHAYFANGIVISNVAHRLFTQAVLPPTAAGPPVVHTFGSQVEMDVSMNGGATFQPFVANATATVSAAWIGGDEPWDNIYHAEMLQLDVAGGLPAGMVMRISPAQASTGETHIQTVPGGYMIDSFFDIWVEISTDFGGSWTPASAAVPMELKVDPALIPPVTAPRPVLPMPNGQYISPQQWHQLYASGIILRDVKHKLFTQWMEPPVFGAGQTHTFDSQLDFQLSTDGGASYRAARAPGTMTVEIKNVREFGEKKEYDTVVLGLQIAGGDLPAGVLIRESPTKASEGGTAILLGPLGGDPYMVSSFFDIFTEVSTDGGGTWGPATNGPARMELERVAPVHEFPSNVLPPPEGEYISPAQWHAYFANGIVISNVIHHRFTQPVAPPEPGKTLTHTFGSQVEMDVSTDGGTSWNPVSMPATVSVRITGRLGGDGLTEYYDTEMLQLDIQGGGTALPIQIRESPTKASLGRTTISTSMIGYRIDSFFDIFTEVSTDGGQSWLAALGGPATVMLQPAGVVPLGITCPPNQVVQATRLGGTVVHYPAPTTSGGVTPVTVTCTPPSGSHFRVGVTPVTCVARDAAGQTARCTFEVKVRPPRRFFRAKLLPPGDGMYVSPQQWHALYANGIVVSNVIHKRFTQGIEPPPPGGSATHTFGSQVQLEVALGLGMPFEPYTAQANVTVRMTHLVGPGAEEMYETEMLALNVQGGSLPPHILVRESPTLASLGETRIATVTGGFMIDSFFDIFTEVSTDGGLTWSPSPDSAAVELTIDPTTVPPAQVPTALLPPLVHKYVSPQDWHVAFANGVVISDVRHAVFTGAVLPPPYGTGASHTFDSQVDMVVSTGLGAPMRMRAPATMTVAALHALDFTDTLYLETEALQLDVAGGDLPLGFRLRESPTLRSQGGTSVSGGGGGAGKPMSSFFDIWVELSTDGGATWLQSTSGPVRVELQTIAPEVEFLTPELPPQEGEYVSPQQWHAYYAQGIIISNVVHRRFTQSFPPPPPGGSAAHEFDSVVDMMVSMPGSGWTPMTAPAHCAVRITSMQDQDATRYFDTEMLQLTIAGGDLPAGVMIRESPTKASTGRTSERSLPIESFRISSFFDVFTELSTDGGQTWQPSQTGPATVILRRTVCEPPVITTEPVDAAVLCHSNATFCVEAKGTPPLRYQWYENGVAMPGQNGRCLTIPDPTRAQNGNQYYAVVANDCGSDTSQTVTLTVIDLIPPTILCPPDQSAETTPDRCDAVVQYPAPRATDDCGQVTGVTCSPPSGATFALGVTTVTCVATDDSENQGRCSFKVTVRDLEPPAITCPPNIVANTDPGVCVKTNVTYAASATDNCPGVTVACVPPSGSAFPKGMTGVTCTATDASGNSRGCVFTVTIRDQEAPVVTCPPDVVATAYAPTGVVVTYPLPTASDNCGVDKVSCAPPSGSVFPVGLTTVVCTATDTSGNEGRCTFEVTVRLIGLEIDKFPNSVARFTVEIGPEPQEITLAGPTEVQVVIGPNGECRDLDGDGRDQAVTTMTQLDLSGFATTLGRIQLRLRPGTTTRGEVEERVNNTPDRLDLPPFVVPPVGLQADSFFDVFVEVTVELPMPMTLHSAGPVHMVAVLTHKPPAANEAYTSTAPVELLDELGQPTGIRLTRVVHIPDPVELDVFPNSVAVVTVRPVAGADPVTLFMHGPTTVEVAIPPDGWAADTDANGRDQALNVMTRLELQGGGPSGPVVLRLDPAKESQGQIEERANNTLGLLDIAPFVPSPTVLLADSFFDVWFEVTLEGLPPMHPAEAVRMESVLTHKPPAPGETYTNSPLQRPIPLLFPDGTPSGYELLRVLHTPVPIDCPRLLAQLVPGTGEPGVYDVMVCWQDDERCQLQWTRDLNTPIRWREWTGPIITRPDGTKCVRITEPKDMMYFRLCGGCPPMP